MTSLDATIDPARWLEFIDQEYFDGFITEGGASVKFAVPLQDAWREEVERSLRERATASNLLSAHIDAGETRVHLIDHIFYRVSEQIPWRQLSENVIVRLAQEQGFAKPGILTPGSLADRMAESNALGSDMVTMQARGWIDRGVFQDRTLVKDFRVAMTHLCLSELSSGPEGDPTIESITDWLTGRNKAVSPVKPYQIYTRIMRTNARYLFESLLNWIRFAGFAGLVMTLNLSRLTIPRNPRDGQLYYSKAQLLDAYEVLRQFVDLTERLEGCFIVAMPAPAFLDVEPASRGIGAYDALRFRIYDEVHDQRLVNPMGALIRLASNSNE